jgi:hypothetical protein
MRTVLLNIFACKELSTRDCILICELRYTNPCLSSPSEMKVTTQCEEQVQTCNRAVWLPMLLSCGFWRTDWAPTAYQQASFALIVHSQRAELDSATNSTEKHYRWLEPSIFNKFTRMVLEKREWLAPLDFTSQWNLPIFFPRNTAPFSCLMASTALLSCSYWTNPNPRFSAIPVKPSKNGVISWINPKLPQ